MQSQQRFRFFFLRVNVLLWLLALLCLPRGQANTQLLPTPQTAGKPSIHYTIAIRRPDAAATDNLLHQLHVTITTPRQSQTPMEFAIPAWTPGYYQILHYENNIHNIQAQDSTGRIILVTHPSKRIWRVEDTVPSTTSPTTVTLSYDVDARDEGLGFFGTSLDLRNQHGYINGASALLYPVGGTQSPCMLSVAVPPGWQIATPLDPQPQNREKPPSTDVNPAASLAVSANSNAAETKSFHSQTYDELIDCPLQLGKFDTIDFQESGVHFECVLVGRQTGSKDGIRASLERITHAAIALFGSAPFSRYLFFYHFGGSGFYGGLEHHNSTVIHLMPGVGSGTNEDFLSVSAHEFFHAWNVKRLHPEGLGPFDYTQPVTTSALWFAEGVTDYYSQLLLVRSGLKTPEWFWRDMLHRIQLLDHTPARVRVSLRDASIHAWEGGSEGYDGLSYYLKGSLAGLYFDLRLRALTHNQAGLDDVMRKLDAVFGARNKAFPEDALLNAINSVANQNLQSEYASLINTTNEIEWNGVLRGAGLQLQREPAPFLGVRLSEEQGNGQPGALVETAEAGNAASRMGLKADDRILTVEGRRITHDNFSDVVHALPLHGSVTILVLRGNETFRLVGAVGTVYEHHQLVSLPLSQLSAAQQAEARQLQAGMFATVREAARITETSKAERAPQ